MKEVISNELFQETNFKSGLIIENLLEIKFLESEILFNFDIKSELSEDLQVSKVYIEFVDLKNKTNKKLELKFDFHCLVLKEHVKNVKFESVIYKNSSNEYSFTYFKHEDIKDFLVNSNEFKLIVIDRENNVYSTPNYLLENKEDF